MKNTDQRSGATQITLLLFVLYLFYFRLYSKKRKDKPYNWFSKNPFLDNPMEKKVMTGNKLLFFFYRPLVREVCPKHQVAIFQHWTGTSRDPGFVANFYISILISPAPTFTLSTQRPPGGDSRSFPLPISLVNCIVSTQNHSPT